ncbi:hypothetical protein GCM10009639_26300 [Kitasatospora putterlickiae]|uniref:Clp R domain-containing protein n=1 Tax=Kitasatospora putterlickiae TaxID=221725 RepID=A0ABN1XYV8_9ACTN
MFERYTDRARRVVVLAQEEARWQERDAIDTEHLLLGLIHEGEGVAAKVLERLGLSLTAVRAEVERRVRHQPHRTTENLHFTPAARKALELSLNSAQDLGHNYIGTEHLLLGVIREDEGVGATILKESGADHSRIRNHVVILLTAYSPPEDPPEPPPEPTSLDRFTRDLSAEASAQEAPTVIGRDSEIERILRVFSRRHRNVALLVGEPGAGTTSVVIGLAEALVSGTAPAEFGGRTVRLLDVGALFTDPQHHGRFTEVMADLVGDVQRSTGLVLFLDNALAPVRTREGRTEALAFFRLVFGLPGVSVVATATTAEYLRWERDAGLDRLVQPVPVHEPGPADVLEILRGARHRLVEHHGVDITDDALQAAARLARDHLPGQALPGAAIDLLDEAAAGLRSAPARSGASPAVDRSVVERTAGASAPRPSPPVPHDPFVWSMS